MYKVEITSESDYHFNVRSKDAQCTIDMHGKKGMKPPDVLLASLGSCVGVYIRKYADGAKLAIGEFAVTVEGDIGKEAPYLFKHISVSIDLKGVVLDERRQKAMIEFIKNCPIHGTLKSSPEVAISHKP